MLRRALLLISLLSGTLLFAQQERSAASANQAGKAATQTSAAGLTIRGCVAAGKRYVLTQQGTGAQFDLQGNAANLGNANGKFVEVIAHELSPAANRDSNVPSRVPLLQVFRMRVLDEHCPAVAPRGTGPAATGLAPEQRTAAPSSAATPKYAPPGAPNQAPPSHGDNPNSWRPDSGAPSPGTGNPPSEKKTSPAPIAHGSF